MTNQIEQRNQRGNQAPFYTKHWGLADQRKEVAQGIICYWTPSHGGYELSAERMLEMPEQYRETSFTGDNCFEEDCSWCGVVMAWPQYFSAKTIEAAQQTYSAFYAGKAA